MTEPSGDAPATGPERVGWPLAAIVVGAAALVVGLVIRWLLLPAEGLKGDIDVFVLWTHGIATDGLPNAYDQNLSFPPVMAYIWGVLAAIEPAFRTVTDSSDPGIRSLMKIPASLADIGLALVVLFALRRTPWVAVLAAAAIFLHPAVIDVSAWWGQYESIYLLSAMVAVLCAINGHNGFAAALLAVSIMTKPQALPLLVPFAAWFWATEGPKGFLRAALIGTGVVLVLWLPFIPAGGPLNYLDNLREYQGELYNILSLRAWNIWWIVESLFAGGHFVADDLRFLGPLTFRHVGFILTGALELVVLILVLRNPTPRSLILGCAAATLVAFSFLTTMHERYAFAAIGFLMFLVPEPRVRWLGIGFAIVFTMNLFSAVPPSPSIHAVLDYTGPITVVGSIAMLFLTLATLYLLGSPPVEPVSDLGEAAGAADGTPPSTSADSGVATSGA